MKKLFMLFAVFILSMDLYSSTETIQEDFKTANTLYSEENYAQAIRAYQRIIEQGYESSALYYNMANSYFKTGRIGFAILNYEKALKLSPGDEDIRFNLDVANSRTIDKINQVPKLFLLEWWDQFVRLFSSETWSFFVVLFFLMIIVATAVLFGSFNNKLRQGSLYSLFAFVPLFIITSIVFFSSLNRETQIREGVLLEESTIVKSSPDTQSADAFIIHEGIKFIIEDEVSNWTRIKIADGKTGWIENSLFGEI